MAGIIGTVDTFNEAEDTWQAYVERLEHFFTANEIVSEPKRKAILLSSVGPKTYKLLSNLVAPRKPGDVPYHEIIDVLQNHHNPRPSTIVQRFKFNTRVRGPGETIRAYVAELRRLTEYCEYNDNLEEMLRDRLVCGINDRKIQQRLLSEKELTFSKALEISQAMEAAAENVHDLSESMAEKVCLVNRHHTPPPPLQKSGSKPCYRCGGPHTQTSCKFKESKCFKCQKIGHISKVCRSGDQHGQSKHKAHVVDVDDQTEESFVLFSLLPSTQAIYRDLLINGANIRFQVDTGASLSVMNNETFVKTINAPLQPSRKILKTYTGETVNIRGEAVVEVSDGNQTLNLPIVVVEKGGPPLLGRNWLNRFNIDLSLNRLDSHHQKLQELLTRHDNIFKSSAGCLSDVRVRLHTKPDSNPKFCRARQPPYALREAIEEELSRLQREGIIEAVEHSDWATPIVPVRKRDGTIRICGDYKNTVNKVCQEDNYPIPRIEDLAYALSGGEKFTKLDLAHAYTQLQLDEDSRKLTTINTHKGLFMYHRLCFGISAAPGIFQRTMEGVFQHVPGCVNYLDDVYVTGKNDEEHLENLNKVFSICQQKGLSLRKDKCEFMQQEVTFLGYRLDKHGIHPLADKVQAIRDAPTPQNTQELRSFLGLLNYYGKFIPNVSQLLAPLYQLLRQGQRWCWGEEQKSAFTRAKNVLSSDKVLEHFDPKKEIVIVCDASPIGVGAILSQVDANGNEKPVIYASRALSDAERKYSQIDREGLAVIFGVKKFHKYVFGRYFKLITDHKPLLGLFGEDKVIPEHASARVQRWAIILSTYSYSLLHRPGRDNSADALSRLPLPYSSDETDAAFGIDCVPVGLNFLFNMLDSSALSARDIAIETQNDKTLKQVYNWVVSGWPAQTEEQFRVFAARKNELSVENDCLLWGTRVVIPPTLETKVLELLHGETHVGMAQMKSQARSWVWWPQIDAEIEKRVRCCYTCQKHRIKSAKAPLFPWEWPEEPWKRVHLDFAGPFLGHMYLIATDAHSKWMEVKVMNKITASDTILALREIFSTLGLPEIIVTDNGPSFTASDFRTFMSLNGIKHITVSPYHPSSNGLAERSVQTFKRAMVKIKSGSVREKLCKFLTKYRCTPHSTTGLSPAELLFGRNIRTHLDLLHPCLHNTVSKHQQAQKSQHDRHAVEREISVGDNVFVRNFGTHGDKWLAGVVIESTGPLSFKVKTNTHGIVRRHQDQVRVSATDLPAAPVDTERLETQSFQSSSNATETKEPIVHGQSQGTVETEQVEDSFPAQTLPQPSVDDANRTLHREGEPLRTRSGRVIKRPERFSE